jgi:hypothetical protein
MGSWTVLLDLNLIVAISFRLETNFFSVCFRGLKLQFRSFAGKMILQRFDFTNKKKPKNSLLNWNSKGILLLQERKTNCRSFVLNFRDC